MQFYQLRAGPYIAIGIGVGTSLGVAFGNPAIGVALGVALGSFMSVARLARPDLLASPNRKQALESYAHVRQAAIASCLAREASGRPR
jgi:hypothetical protein